MDNVLMLLLVFVVLVVVAFSFGSVTGGDSLPMPTIPMAPQAPPMYQLGDDFQYSEEQQDAHSMADPEESVNQDQESE